MHVRGLSGKNTDQAGQLRDWDGGVSSWLSPSLVALVPCCTLVENVAGGRTCKARMERDPVHSRLDHDSSRHTRSSRGDIAPGLL